MASKAQITLANKILNIIKTEGAINKFSLMDKAEISIATYNQLSAWFQHRYVDEMHMVEYDKKTKNWIWREVIQVNT